MICLTKSLPEMGKAYNFSNSLILKFFNFRHACAPVA
jgi:hypothetical protein